MSFCVQKNCNIKMINLSPEAVFCNTYVLSCHLLNFHYSSISHKKNVSKWYEESCMHYGLH